MNIRKNRSTHKKVQTPKKEIKSNTKYEPKQLPIMKLNQQ